MRTYSHENVSPEERNKRNCIQFLREMLSLNYRSYNRKLYLMSDAVSSWNDYTLKIYYNTINDIETSNLSDDVIGRLRDIVGIIESEQQKRKYGIHENKANDADSLDDLMEEMVETDTKEKSKTQPKKNKPADASVSTEFPNFDGPAFPSTDKDIFEEMLREDRKK